MKLALTALSTALLAVSAHAETCTDFKTCSQLMFELKGQRYVWDAKMEEHKFTATPNVEMSKENAELIFTALLDQAGLARLPVGDGKTYRVERNVNLKEISAPVFDASAEHAPVIPMDTWDWVTMRYKLKSADEANVIESMYRLHLPREARMQADENAGLLLVTGTIPMVKQMYVTISAADKPVSSTAKKHYQEWRTGMLKENHAAPAPAAAKK
jgi:hypothetical protein